jgi:glycosyltransferase involved in cell wall biosynthesis
MKVSIITVCYNSAATIRDTIESVLAQDYADIEYIIVDGASKDNTLSIVSEYRDRIATVISEPDKGIYDAMNKGILAATGDVVGILNSDDFYESTDALSAVVKAFRENEKAELIFGDLVFVKPTDLKKVTRFYSLPNYSGWKLRFGWMPPHPATFIRKDVYDRFGLYKTNFKIAADYELFVRLLMVKRIAFKHIDKVLIRMRSGGASTSGIQSSMTLNHEIIRACRANNVYTNMLFLMFKIPFKLVELLRRPSA